MRKIKLKPTTFNTIGLQVLFCAALGSLAWGQGPEALPKTKVQVNFLNSCNPSPVDLEEMGRALAHVKDRPAFSSDFEISRGQTTLSAEEARAAGAAEGSGSTHSTWVRIRREFPEKAVLTNVQYSVSTEGTSSSEILAMHLRDVKAAEAKAGDSREVLQILLSDTVAGTPAQVVKVDTPPDRIRIERFGKASIVLARCASVDQSAYEPLFQSAAGIMEKYRLAMSVKTVVPGELSHLPVRKESKIAGENHK